MTIYRQGKTYEALLGANAECILDIIEAEPALQEEIKRRFAQKTKRFPKEKI